MAAISLRNSRCDERNAHCSDSDSFKSIKSSFNLLPHSSILLFNGDAGSSTLLKPSNLYGSDSTIPTATPGSNGHPNPYTPLLPQISDVHKIPPTFSEVSFHAFDSSPPESKDTVHFVANDTKLLDRPPTAIPPFVSIFQPTIDKSLLKPQQPPTLDGYVQAHSLPNLATSVDPSPPPNSHVPIPSDYIPPYSPSATRPPSPTHCNLPDMPGPPPGSGSSDSSSDLCFTAPEYKSETCATSPQSGLGRLQATNESSNHMLGSHRPPSNGRIDQSPGALQHQPIFADGKANSNTSDTQLPHSASFFLFHPRVRNPPSPKGPVHDGSLLTSAIHAAVNEAVTLWEATQWNRASTLPSSSNPFSCSSPEDLECQYAIAIDAKNALTLRQLAIVADIGLYLELLIPKISVHATDKTRLIGIHQNLDFLRQECVRRQIHLPFSDIEWCRSADHPCSLAFVDQKRHQEFSWRERILEFGELYADATARGMHFLDDPLALMENRLPKLESQK